MRLSVKIVSSSVLLGKLADYSQQDLNHTELSLIEGDSAGGSKNKAVTVHSK